MSVDKKTVAENENLDQIGNAKFEKEERILRENLLQVLDNQRISMENNQLEQQKTIEAVKEHLKKNTSTALVESVATPEFAAAITVCGDGRTTGVEDMVKGKKEGEKVYWENMKNGKIDPLAQPERLQVFGGYSGLLLGAMGSLNKKHLFGEKDIVSIFEQFTTGIPKIYEHSDDHNHDHNPDYCGCGHIKNLRTLAGEQNQFGLTKNLIEAHKKIVTKENKVQVEELTDSHKEKGIIIVAGSHHSSEGGESILTINANKKNEQYFVVNLDAAYIMLERIAKDIDDIQRQQGLRNGAFLTQNEIFETLKAGFHDQLKSTAGKLAPHLFENNTVFVSADKDGKPKLDSKNMAEVAATLSSLDEEKKDK